MKRGSRRKNNRIRVDYKAACPLIKLLVLALCTFKGTPQQVRDWIQIVQFSGHPEDGFLRPGLKQVLMESRVADRDVIGKALAAFTVQVSVLPRPIEDSAEKLSRHFIQCPHSSPS